MTSRKMLRGESTGNLFKMINFNSSGKQSRSADRLDDKIRDELQKRSDPIPKRMRGKKRNYY